VASFKFALGKSILTLATSGSTSTWQQSLRGIRFTEELLVLASEGDTPDAARG
jgi:hypothetical protein